MSARMDFSSMLWREIAPKGRGKVFSCDLACGGSAGSRGAVCCANAETAAISNITVAAFDIFLPHP
jgi:hypothetical protein